MTLDFIPEGWSAISDPSVTFTQLDSGISEDLWTLDSSERAHVQNNDIWTLVGSDRLYYVSAGDSGVWAVNRDGRVIFREGITPSRPQGTRWKDLGNERFIQVDSGPYSTVLAIRRNNELVFRNGINTLNPAGRSWIGLGRRFSHVSAGSYGIWAVDGNADAYFAVRPSDLRSSGLSWNRIPGPKMRRIEAGYNGKVFALGVDGNMYQRTALNLYQPDGAKWNPIGTGLRTLTIGQDRLLGISSNGRIVKKDGENIGFSRLLLKALMYRFPTKIQVMCSFKRKQKKKLIAFPET